MTSRPAGPARCTNDRHGILDALASGQHGLATRGQLRARGLTDRQIDVLWSSGRIHPVHRGVFRVLGSPASPEQRLLAACLAGGPDAVASHRGAAWLWGATACGELMPEITLPRAFHPEIGAVVHRRLPSPLDSPHDHVTRRGIPTTTPLTTLVQLGAVTSEAIVRRTMDDFVSRTLVTVSGVVASLHRLGGRGRRGAGVLRRVLERRGLGLDDHDGGLEPLFADLCRQFDLPMPAYQVPIVLGGRPRRIDFAYARRRIAIEVDGYEFHSRFDVFEDDRIRGNELELLGWTVLRFTWHQVVHQPGRVAATIRAALALPHRQAA